MTLYKFQGSEFEIRSDRMEFVLPPTEMVKQTSLSPPPYEGPTTSTTPRPELTASSQMSVRPAGAPDPDHIYY
jgi:hypothetical protein